MLTVFGGRARWRYDQANLERATSYRQGEPLPHVPRTWTLTVGNVFVTVTRGHLYYPDEWVLQCAPWYNTQPLGFKSDVGAEHAQTKALLLVRAKVAALNTALQEVR